MQEKANLVLGLTSRVRQSVKECAAGGGGGTALACPPLTLMPALDGLAGARSRHLNMQRDSTPFLSSVMTCPICCELIEARGSTCQKRQASSERSGKHGQGGGVANMIIALAPRTAL